MLCSAREDTVDKTAMSLSLESHIVLRKWDFTSFIAEKLRSQEAELTGRVRAMQAKRYNSWKACLYGSKNLANSRKWGLIFNFFGGHRGHKCHRGPPPVAPLGTAPETYTYQTRSLDLRRNTEL